MPGRALYSHRRAGSDHEIRDGIGWTRGADLGVLGVSMNYGLLREKLLATLIVTWRSSGK